MYTKVVSKKVPTPQVTKLQPKSAQKKKKVPFKAQTEPRLGPYVTC